MTPNTLQDSETKANGNIRITQAEEVRRFMPELMCECSRCTANIVFREQDKVVRCIYCQYPNQRPQATGSTLDKLKRGNRLLQQCQFEEAEKCYKRVLKEYPDEHEALWGRLMCKYGVEVAKEEKYGTVRRYLLCHRARRSSIRNEGDFRDACKYANPLVREQYEKDAAYIDNVQQRIREAAEHQESYDVFICYKETDLETGERTKDSMIAQRLYNRYTLHGYRVFFARETLCDKMGEDYEAAIYQAIATAKVMLVVGLKEAHFNAVWPKSEWMRYLEKMNLGEEGLLIPVYGEMKAEELPVQFQNLSLHGCCIDTNLAYIEDIESKLYRIIRKPVPLPPQMQVHHEESSLEGKPEAPHEELPRQEVPAAVKRNPHLMGITTISAGYAHTVGLKTDGTAVAVGSNSDGQCKVSDWTDIVTVSAGGWHTVGLKSDGTLVAVGKNIDGRRDVSDWKNIVAVSAGYNHTMGLKEDGTVVATGDNDSDQCEISDWENIVAISAGQSFTVGLKEDGTVVAVGQNTDSQCDVTNWKNIVAVSAGYDHTVGLKEDGTVVAVGNNDMCQCEVSDWENIAAVSAGEFYTVGLKNDGTVVTTNFLCDVSGWENIAAVSAGDDYYHMVGLREDGTAVAVGRNEVGECEVSGWAGICVPIWAKNVRMTLEELAAPRLEFSAAVSDKPKKITYPDGKYVGEIVNGKRHGKGVMYYRDEDKFNRIRYDGEWKDDKRHGHGVMTWKGGNKYDGEWKDSARHGKGMFYFASGDRYEGDFENGKISGKGVIYYSDEDVFIRVKYDGEWKDNERNGHGMMTWKNGEKYDGEWKDGKRTGQGVYYLANGNRYEGDFEDNKFNGKGVLYYSDEDGLKRDKYDGEWKNGMFNGHGVLTWKSGLKYDGEWKDNERHGHGLLSYSDGEKYDGEWKEGNRDGHGVFYHNNGDKYDGEWRVNSRTGQGVFYYVNGDRYEGEFWDGNFFGRGTLIKRSGRKIRYQDGKPKRFF